MMEAPEALVDHLPFLLQDLPSLSGAEAAVIDALRSEGFPNGGAVLDLGCGRGDIAFAVARAIGARVDGVDAHDGFIEAARRKAQSAGLADRCRFVAGDLRDALKDGGPYDAVLLIALGPVLGGPAETMSTIRRAVRPGGLIVIDDAYLAAGAAPLPEWESYAPLDETETALQTHGDAIIARRDRRDEDDVFNAMALENMERRAGELAERMPRLKPDLDTYIARQHREVAYLREDLVPAMWVLRKSS